MPDNDERLFAPRPIKSVTALQLEDAIARAITEVTGRAYEVKITRHDLEPHDVLNAWSSDVSDIQIRVSKPLHESADSLFGRASDKYAPTDAPKAP